MCIFKKTMKMNSGKAIEYIKICTEGYLHHIIPIIHRKIYTCLIDFPYQLLKFKI